MKRTLSVLVLAGTALAGFSAQSAPVFMLQFGSYESRAEADQKLDALKTKHAGVLSRMEAGVREVALPPNNLTVYRTQAGPLATRADAQSVCSQLASNGDECYVVETAIMPNFTSVAAAPAPVPAAAPVPVRDMKNVDAMSRVTASADAQANKPVAVAAAATETDPMAAQMQDDMADAAYRQQEGLPARDPKPAKQDRSLWDRLFGSDEPEKAPAPKKPDVNAAVQAVPVEPIAVTAAAEPVVTAAPVVVAAAPAPKPGLMPVTGASAPQAVAVAAAAPAPAPAPQPLEPIRLVPPAAQAEPVAVAAPVPVAPAAAPVPVAAAVAAPEPLMEDAQPLLLPPPPAPLAARNTVPPVAAAPIAVQPVATAPMPVVNVPVQPAPFAVASSNPSSVQVEEARRVPLSQAAAQPVLLPALMPASVNPAATIGRKTLWAQIGPFPHEAAARAYWEQYRQQHPDFPVVRVRVTSPMGAYTRGLPHTTLRIGPFEQGAFIRTLCSTLVNKQNRLQCGPVVDLGQSTSASGRRGLLPSSRYNR